MPGPAPKHSATRRRQNRHSTAATLPAEVPPAEPPALPDEREWHPQTRSWWLDVFASPMASEFLRADIHGLIRALSDELDRQGEDAGLALGIVNVHQERTQARGFEPIRSTADRHNKPEAHLAALAAWATELRQTGERYTGTGPTVEQADLEAVAA